MRDCDCNEENRHERDCNCITENSCEKDCHSECKMSLFARYDLAQDLREFMGKSLLIVLDDYQLNILNQVFRPIFCGIVGEVTNEYVVLEKVNIKMSNAPEFIFPTPLVIPLINIVWFTPFDPSIRFSLY